MSNMFYIVGLTMPLNSIKSSLDILSSSSSLPTRQVQMFDVAIPLVVELVLLASYTCILPPSSSPASFVLVFLLIFFIASITVFNSDSPLRVCPIHFFCLVFNVRMRDLSSPIVSNISSFVLCSVQLTFCILLQVHISKASSLFILYILYIYILYILFFTFFTFFTPS